MAGWQILKNGFALDCVKILHTFRSIGFCIDIDSQVRGSVDYCGDELRCLFDQILLVFLKEVVGRECIRPCPAMLGDGRPVDFFKLFWFVRGRGGYDWVSKNNMWEFMAEEFGFDVGVAASVRLIYSKYLYELDTWLGYNRDRNLGNVQCKYGEGLDVLSLDIGAQFRGLLTDGQDCEMNNGNMIQLKPNKNGRSIVLHIEKSKVHIWAVGNECKVYRSGDNIPNDDDEKIYNDDNDNVLILEPTVAKKICDSRKRKRGSFSGMLNWITQVAKQPNDPSIVMLKDPASKEFRARVLSARVALLLKRKVTSNAEHSLLQKKLKMHPSMYEDIVVLDHQSREGLRCSRRLSSLMGSHLLCPCCEPNLATKSALVSPRKAETGNSPEQASVAADLSATHTTASPSEDNPLEKQISVGPLFQAEVPHWTGEASESDSKWLGTRIWPWETGGCNFWNETDPIGKGREDSCFCQFPGSVYCVRFHVAEKRMKLKLELGAVFYFWRFDRMGEEVSLSWTIEEEKKFKDVVRLNSPYLDKCFWDDAFKCFPTKTRENLVSYYFNVFLVNRRSYQNRVTPKNIDSDDDDETKFGSLSEGFGLEVVKVHGSTVQVCTQSKQCFDLDRHIDAD